MCVPLYQQRVYIHYSVMISFIYAGGRMGSVSQSAVLPSLLAAPTLATKCVLIWTTTDAARAPTATGGVETLE